MKRRALEERQEAMRLRLRGRKEPRAPQEWQEVVDWCDGLLGIDSARQYGLITGGPAINVDRCVALLERGRALGYIPSPDAAEQVVAALMEVPQ